MKRIVGTKKLLLQIAASRGGNRYLEEIQPAYVGTLPDGQLVYDGDHPAYVAAVNRHRKIEAKRKAAAPTPPHRFLPTREEQDKWWESNKATCEKCPAFGGLAIMERRVGLQIRCADCNTCGTKTIGALQDCPRGHFTRWRRAPELAATPAGE